MGKPHSAWVISMESELCLNVSATLPLSHANGPGCRAVIWVRGCSLGCAGCYNPDTHLHTPKHLVPASELAEWASSIKGIEGLTFSGGEPFEQAGAVAEVTCYQQEGMSQQCGIQLCYGVGLLTRI